MQIDPELTSISESELMAIYENDFTADDVYRYLTKDIRLRTFPEILGQFYCGSDLKERLTAELSRMDGVSRDSASRKVRDWLGNKYAPSEREDLIKLCFILEINESDADAFLVLTGSNPLHLRDPWELTCAYCLRTGKSYEQAREMMLALPSIPALNKQNEALPLTKIIANSFSNICDDRAFYDFYAQNREAFGSLHDTAYHCFLHFISLLAQPITSYAQAEERYSIDAVVNGYLRMDLPLDKKTAHYTVLQKTIRKFWPNATSITRTINRQEDVTRRVLLLLYLITEGGLTGNEADAYLLDEDLTDEERFEEHYWRLNSMLNDCGFGRLDPRSVFDWLVLYCLKSSDEEAMGERMESVLSVIFNTETA